MTPNLVRYACAFLCAACLEAQSPPMKLWPGMAPGDKPGLGEEHDTTTAKDNLIAGRPLIRLGNVSTPTITVYRASADKDTGTAVVVCPGGGYNILAMDLEGTEVCEWLNSIGVTGVLLKYRVPAREGQPRYAAPLQDAQRAMGLVRSHAKEWGIRPDRIGVLGFSAGGHLCAALCAHTDVRSYTKVDDADDVSCSPNFQVLIYPGGLVPEGSAWKIDPSVAVSEATPPTFLAMAQDDPVRAENVLGYAMALKQVKVPLEVHVYPTGGHGYGLRQTKDFVTTWPQRVADWMRSRGLLDRS